MACTVVEWSTVWSKVIIPMVTSPFVGLILAFMVMRLIVTIFRNKTRRRWVAARHAQASPRARWRWVAACRMRRKTMGVIFLLLVGMGYASASDAMPVWVVIACAGAISIGTAIGETDHEDARPPHRIDLDPARGFSAGVRYQRQSSTSLRWSLDAPVSTTQVITGGIAGAGRRACPVLCAGGWCQTSCGPGD